MPRSTVSVVAVTLTAALAVVALLAVAFVRSGAYDVGATAQHTPAVYWLLERTMRYSVRVRARQIDAPVLASPQLAERGLQCFHQHCVDCHGAPGIAPAQHAWSLQPRAGPLTGAARQWSPSELFWIARHGIRMSGMPAWRGRIADEDLWAIVAFLRQVPGLSPADYRARVVRAGGGKCIRDGTSGPVSALPPAGAEDVQPNRDADADEVARDTLRQYGCDGCHSIPGIVGPDSVIGPPLAGFGRRALVAGRWPNTEAHVVEWIRDPQRLDPRTAMPHLEVTEQDALRMARYLRSLK